MALVLFAVEAVLILVLLVALLIGQPASYDRMTDELATARGRVAVMSTRVAALEPTVAPCHYSTYPVC